MVFPPLVALRGFATRSGRTTTLLRRRGARLPPSPLVPRPRSRLPMPLFFGVDGRSRFSTRVRVGDVEGPVRRRRRSSGHSSCLVPSGVLDVDRLVASEKRVLRWLLSKDVLGQDALLIGGPGGAAAHRRRLALAYAEMTGREVEFASLTSDTTESDLKQRRELERGSVTFVDQAPVRAALKGRLLVLEGLERCGRNVLPTLNNLLENREMNLEDGRLLVSAERYRELAARDDHDSSSSFLVPVHEDFRVIACAVPVPPFAPGRSLDPPLRSRFQVRRVDDLTAEESYERLSSSSSYERDPGTRERDDATHRDLAIVHGVLSRTATSGARRRASPALPARDLEPIARCLRTFPGASWEGTLSRSSPGSRVPRGALARVGRDGDDAADHVLLRVVRVGDRAARIEWRRDDDGDVVAVEAARGPRPLLDVPSSSSFVPARGASRAVDLLTREHAVADRDVLLVSAPGAGATTVARAFADRLGYRVREFALTSETTAADLWSRRSAETDDASATTTTAWHDSPLVEAARNGDVCVLDGIDRIPPDAAATLDSLLVDREAWLPDGRRLGRAERYPDHDGRTFVPVHPSFRVVATATDLDAVEGVRSGFRTVVLSPPDRDDARAIVESKVGRGRSDRLDRLLRLREALDDGDHGTPPLSLRRVVRVLRRSRDDDDDASFYDALSSELLLDLLPPSRRATTESLLSSLGIERPRRRNDHDDLRLVVSPDTVAIGDEVFSRRPTSPDDRPELVPSVDAFEPVPAHVRVVRDLWRALDDGERSFLLLGDQGVGKNVIVDALCGLRRVEREYLQLHRDSTVGQLTLTPSLEDGGIVWRDSPLVRAATRGRVLVVDEADKAPSGVARVLRELADDDDGTGELRLADGRRLRRGPPRPDDDDDVVRVHPDFALLVLANRPGFPFLGNDLVRSVGDRLATTVVGPTDSDSEVRLLRSYGPTVDEGRLRRLAGAFADARDADGSTYPYSTREAVSVVKHWERYGVDDQEETAALRDVLDFDSYDPVAYDVLTEVFRRHGFELRTWDDGTEEEEEDLEIEYANSDGTSGTPPPLSSPKHGEWDDDNDPHVGGNTWAGGTGGSDTAGLGGRGGPYRLDRGHKVHQVDDEAKAAVSDQVNKAARAMAEKALRDKLEEIRMDQNEWDRYQRFADGVRSEVGTLRRVLMASLERTEEDEAEAERGWIKRQGHGELDDARLVEASTGERYVYKRRGRPEDEDRGTENDPCRRPRRKIFSFVLDCSGSMYRFNGHDGRLERCLETALLLMESFAGLDERGRDRFDVSLVGHSGDSSRVPLAEFGALPSDEKERARVLRAMIAHSRYCRAGDHTLAAVERAVDEAADFRGDDGGDDVFVVGISDANLSRYGIAPRSLGRIIERAAERNVQAHCVFIASLDEEADQIRDELPLGRGHVCLRTSDLPKVMRDLLSRFNEQ